jgi:hypothetical protein
VSTITSLVLFGTARSVEPTLVSKVLKLLGMQNSVFVTRYAEEDQSWRNLMDGIEEYPAHEILGARVPAEEAPIFYETGKLLKISGCEANPKAYKARIIYALHDLFPEETAREFYLNNLDLTFGAHDLFTTEDFPEPKLFGRPNVSLSFNGYRMPHNWEQYRAAAFALPLVQEVKEGFEAIIDAPVEMVMYTS